MRAADAGDALLDDGLRRSLGGDHGLRDGLGCRFELCDDAAAHAGAGCDAMAAITQRALMQLGHQHPGLGAADIENRDHAFFERIHWPLPAPEM